MSAVHDRAARVWRHRRRAELEAAVRFETLAAELASFAAPEAVVEIARRAASDERRHAELCGDLVEHFGGTRPEEPALTFRRVAPRHLVARERTLYEVVAMSCVTETLSTALLGALVERASDSLAKRTMHSILRDEVLHSRLGWAYLAQRHERGDRDCVGPYLPRMLEATLGDDSFSVASEADPLAQELSGLGSLDPEASRRVVRDALDLVVLPGLRRFGIDVTEGERWLASTRARPRAHAGFGGPPP